MSDRPVIEPTAAGASLRVVARTLLASLRSRADLMVLELSQFQGQIRRQALVAGAGMLALGLLAQMLAMSAVAWSWNTPYRLQVAVALAMLFGAAASACLLAWLRLVRNAPPLLDGTLLTLTADVEALS